MKNTQSKSNGNKTRSLDPKKSNQNDSKSSTKKMIEEWRKEIQALSYEESIQSLDLLMTQLQNDSIPIEKLQEGFIKGKLYLEHCENLLSNVEQSIIELDPVTLLPNN